MSPVCMETIWLCRCVVGLAGMGAGRVDFLGGFYERVIEGFLTLRGCGEGTWGMVI